MDFKTKDRVRLTKRILFRSAPAHQILKGTPGVVLGSTQSGRIIVVRFDCDGEPVEAAVYDHEIEKVVV